MHIFLGVSFIELSGTYLIKHAHNTGLQIMWIKNENNINMATSSFQIYPKTAEKKCFMTALGGKLLKQWDQMARIQAWNTVGNVWCVIRLK